MKTHEDIAVATYSAGLHEDGWIGRDATLVVLTYAPFVSLNVSFWTPDNAGVRRAVIACGKWSGKVETKPGGFASLDVPCPVDAGGMELRVKIIGAAPAQPPDRRILGAILAGIDGVRGEAVQSAAPPKARSAGSSRFPAR